MNYIDLFAGAGGLSEGFIRAGYEPVAHVEMDLNACCTLKTRACYHFLRENGQLNIHRDYLRGNISREQLYAAVPQDVIDSVICKEISPKTIEGIFATIDQRIENHPEWEGSVDLIIGGPPCQAYSTLGRAIKSAKDRELAPEEIIEDSRNFLYKLGLKASTQVTYEHRIYDQIIPKIGDIPLNSITASTLERFYAELRYGGRLIRRDIYGEGLSMATIRHIHFHCKAALDRAVKDRLILSNPADACTPIPKRSAEVEVLSPEEMQRLMIQAKEEGFFEMFMLDLGTGLRRGELLGLQWSDINFETGEVKITRQINMVGDTPTESKLKTKSSNRTIILEKPMLDMLREYKETVNSRWLFPSPVFEDKPRDPTACRKKLSQILEHAGCKHVKFHALRHTYATMALAYGMDVKTLSATLGHASVSETLDTYSHTTDEMQRSAAAKIDKAFGNAEEADFEEEEREEKQSYPRPDFEPYKGKKRRSGTGYVKQLSKNCWQGRYTPTIGGKRISENVYGKTEDECKAKLAELIDKMNRKREEGTLGFDLSM